MHLLNTHFPLQQSLQIASANQIGNYASSLRGPVVLTGDLNTHHSPLEAGKALDVFHKSGFADSMGWKDVPTWGSSYKEVNNASHKLDYILVKGLASGVSGAVSSFKDAAGNRPSDHELCTASLKV